MIYTKCPNKYLNIYKDIQKIHKIYKKQKKTKNTPYIHNYTQKTTKYKIKYVNKNSIF